MELMPFVVGTCGGMGPAAVKLLKAMAEAGQEHLAMWHQKDIIRHVVGSVAVAVQRGTVMAYLQGYDRALTVLGQPSVEKNAGCEKRKRVLRRSTDVQAEEEWVEEAADENGQVRRGRKWQRATRVAST
jgi:hypothetical protein